MFKKIRVAFWRTSFHLFFNRAARELFVPTTVQICVRRKEFPPSQKPPFPNAKPRGSKGKGFSWEFAHVGKLGERYTYAPSVVKRSEKKQCTKRFISNGKESINTTTVVRGKLRPPEVKEQIHTSWLVLAFCAWMGSQVRMRANWDVPPVVCTERVMTWCRPSEWVELFPRNGMPFLALFVRRCGVCR